MYGIYRPTDFFLNNFSNYLTVFNNLRYTYMILLYVLSFFLGSVTETVTHDIHISKAEIHYKSERKVLQISLHIFLDDLEAELEELGGKNLYLCTEKESDQADTYLMKYLNERFVLSDLQQKLKLSFVGKETSEDLLAVWCYLQIEDFTLNELAITNRIMITRYEDQKNIVSFKVDGKRKAFHILDMDETSQSLIKS